MKKSSYMLIIMIAILGLSACGNTAKSAADDLQSKKWNVVSSDGESYTAEFAKDTVSFKMGSFMRGFTYSIEDNELNLVEEGEEPVVFEIEKNGDEYFLKATTDAIKDQFGDLTLSPNKD